MRICHLTVLVMWHEVQREAGHSPEQRNFERDSEGKTKVLSKEQEVCPKVLSEDKKHFLICDFQPQEAPKNISSMLEQ